MQPYQMQFTVTAEQADSSGHARPGTLLFFIQEAAGVHCALLGADRQALEPKHLFWAVLRHKVEITRLPLAGETVTVETWPMPTTRTAYPRAAVGYDADGKLLFRIISLWVLMDSQTRAMVLPGKSGVQVDGFLRGCELTPPGSIAPGAMSGSVTRTVDQADLDQNIHMNNTRYLDWIWDLPACAIPAEKSLREFTVCYLSEARLDETLTLSWRLSEGDILQIEGCLEKPGKPDLQERVFAALLMF